MHINTHKPRSDTQCMEKHRGVTPQGRKASATHYLLLLQTDSRAPVLQDIVNLLLNHQQLQVALVLVQMVLLGRKLYSASCDFQICYYSLNLQCLIGSSYGKYVQPDTIASDMHKVKLSFLSRQRQKTQKQTTTIAKTVKPSHVMEYSIKIQSVTKM